jgi:hypothetical protein
MSYALKLAGAAILILFLGVLGIVIFGNIGPGSGSAPRSWSCSAGCSSSSGGRSRRTSNAAPASTSFPASELTALLALGV